MMLEYNNIILRSLALMAELFHELNCSVFGNA
jgi:hypothetical protein